MQLLLSILIVLNFLELVHLEQVNITCSPSTSCSTRYKYQYQISTGTRNITGQYCSNTTLICPFQNAVLEMFACQKSISGKECASGICYYPINRTACVDQYYAQCEQYEKVSVKCGKCEQNECSSNTCLKSDGSQQCYLQNQCSLQQYEIQRVPCSNQTDFMGKQCFCCGRYVIKGQYGLCMQDEQFSSNDLIETVNRFRNTHEFLGIKNLIILMAGFLLGMFAFN